jgi:hypothetical protein
MADTNPLGIIAIAAVIVIALFLVPPSLFNPNRDVSTYEETIQFTISLVEDGEFSILLPMIFADGSVTPALQDIASNPQVRIVTRNSTQFIEINGTDSLGFAATAFKPDISGSATAYESFLFDHSYDLDAEGRIPVILYANSSATVNYILDAETTQCEFEPHLQLFSNLVVSPGKSTYSTTQYGFPSLCA